MSGIILPPTVLFNQERERLVERRGELNWFNRQLRQIDPRLELVKATEHPQSTDLTPGYWHVVRHNEPPAPDTYIAIKGDHGEFIEPSTGWLERFRADDAWSNGGWAELTKRWAKREQARERDKQRVREERVEEIADRIKAQNPGVSFSDTPWTYRAGARKDAA
jgi:hypothetical protein